MNKYILTMIVAALFLLSSCVTPSQKNHPCYGLTDKELEDCTLDYMGYEGEDASEPASTPDPDPVDTPPEDDPDDNGGYENGNGHHDGHGGHGGHGGKGGGHGGHGPS